MATVELSFSALPAHVRTARLVAAAVARRSGVDEAVLDEVRLAVGEACSRAVHLHRRHCPDRPVMVTLTDDSDAFRVAVTDQGPSDDAVDEEPGLQALAESSDADVELLDDLVPPGVGLAVISGLVDDVSVERGTGADGRGLVVRMAWPTSS
ncbi:MAG: ATP-binding protein [Sporichthyaceae bacterium]|nr:ATP-binding protein [Sporichthyaceae bacterium]